MAKQYKRKRTESVPTQVLIVPPRPAKAVQLEDTTNLRPDNPDFNRGMAAMRSFYSNAVAWGNSLIDDNRNDYTLDDASVARLYGISVTAWACANYRAESESGIAPRVVDANEKEIGRDDNPLIWLMDNHALLMFRISISMLVWGKFFVLKVRNRAGKPTRLRWLNPLDVSPDIDYERQEFRGFRVRGIDEMVPPQDVIYDLSFDPLNEFGSVSPFMVAMRQVVGDRELVRFAQKFFQDGTMLGGMLTYTGNLTDDEYQQTKADFAQFKGSQNAFKTFIAGGGLATFDYKPMQSAPVDLAMPELKDMIRVDTCAAFGVNPILIGIGEAKDPLSAQSTYQTIRITFIDEHAVPRVTAIYQALSEQWLRHDFSDWGELRIMPNLDAITSAGKATLERGTTAVANVQKIWTLDEAREFTGRTPIPFPAIQVNPDWALAMYDKGILRRNQVLAATGQDQTARAIDGYVYEIDPRAKGGNANMFGGGSPGGSGGAGTSSAQSLPPGAGNMGAGNISAQRALPAGDELPAMEAQIISQPPIISDPIITKAQLYELEAWQGKVRKKGIDAPFEVKHLSEPIAWYVRTELNGLWNPNAVFSEAKTAVRTGRDPQPMGAAIQDANDYWHDYDQLQTDLGAAWLDYMQAVSGSKFDKIANGIPVDLDKTMADNHGPLLAAWLGTKQQPGVLAKVLYAGLQAGDKSLQKVVSANPNKPRAIGIGISWAIDSSEAYDFMQSYSLNLIRAIDDTTKEQIRNAESQYISGTIDKQTLYSLLADTLASPDGTLTDAILRRAKSIGDTESANAFNQGAAQRWTNANVQQAKLFTVRDDSVCPTCRGDYGVTADLFVGWKTANGTMKLPPLHTGCRCFMRPVVN